MKLNMKKIYLTVTTTMAACLLFACLFFVPAKARASNVKLNKKKITMTLGKSSVLKAANTKKNVRFTSANPSVASVKKTGRTKAKVTAKKAGKTRITVKVGKASLSCKVTVTNENEKQNNAKKENVKNNHMPSASSTQETKEKEDASSSDAETASGNGTTTDTGEKDKEMIVTRSSLDVGDKDYCNAGDYEVFFPYYICPKPTAEEGIAWIASLSEEEKAYVEEQINDSSYAADFKEELLFILYGKVSMDDAYKEELYNRCGRFLRDHVFDACGASTSVVGVYKYGDWVQIPASEYEAWAAVNIR